MYPSSNTVATQEALLSEKRLAAELATARKLGSIPCPWQKKKSRQERKHDSTEPSGGQGHEGGYMD